MKKLLIIAAFFTCFSTIGSSAFAEKAVQVGMLTCHVEGGFGFIVGSKKSMVCQFKHTSGLVERYTGVVRKFGIDIGRTDETIIKWAVFAPSVIGDGGRLAGNYGGVSGQASFVVGLGANVLVGGWNDSFALQPVSVQAQTGYDIAIGIARLTLRYHP